MKTKNKLFKNYFNEKKFVLYLFLFLITTFSFAQKFPAKFSGVQLAGNLNPVGMEVAPDGRLFVIQKDGRILVFKNDLLLSRPLLTIPNVSTKGERGVMEVVLDVDFATNGYIYVFYTRSSGSSSNNRVSRFTVVNDEASVSSEFVIIELDRNESDTGFHNGGGMGIIGNKIYISTGDSTTASNSQTLNNLKGKILRLNTDGTIPTDNPFYSTATGSNRAIWALGFRNPFKLSVENGTGRLFSTDVGDGSREEINEIEKGKNYGWPMIEGKRTTQTPPANYKDPIHDYRTRDGGTCSITAGSFYSPNTTSFPNTYLNKFFFADYCAGWIRLFNPANGAVENFASEINRPIEVAINNKNGALYFIARGSGENEAVERGILWKVNYDGNGIPVIGLQPNNITVSIGQSGTFKIVASGSPAPTYQWQRNGVNISGATNSSYTIANPTLADSGARYRVRVSNSEGSVTSNEATLTVIDNQMPEPTITTPAFGTKYTAGDVINFSGTATDKEDGDLAASAFTWRVELYHFDNPVHFHPVLDNTKGIKSGSFTIPKDMETSPNVLFRIYLTVVDSKGGTKSITRDVTPIISKITIVTNPPGLKIRIDGNEVSTPYTFDGAKGVNRIIEAPSPQTNGGSNYAFSSWSDGGARSHTISTPNSTTFTATFTKTTIIGGTPGITSGVIYEMEPQHVTGQRLDVRGLGTDNGTLVDMYPNNGGSNQKWKFTNIRENLYYIEPQNAIGKVLGVVGNSTLENALVAIYDKANQSNLIWKAIPVEGTPSLFRFEPQNAIGKRLDIELLNGNQSAASRALDTGRSQRWKLIPTSSVSARIANDEDQFFAHPNPFKDNTKIALPAKDVKAKKSIEITNFLGKVVKVIDLSPNENEDITIERNGLEAGIYFYSFKMNDAVLYSKKMIIIN